MLKQAALHSFVYFPFRAACFSKPLMSHVRPLEMQEFKVARSVPNQWQGQPSLSICGTLRGVLPQSFLPITGNTST